MDKLIQSDNFQTLQNPSKLHGSANMYIDKNQKHYCKKLLKRTNNNRTRSNSRGSNSINQQQIEELSKFYVKNIFQDGTTNYSNTSIKHPSNQQIRKSQQKQSYKINQARKPQIRGIRLQSWNSSSNLTNSQLIKQSKNQLTFDSIYPSQKQLLSTVKELKNQLLHSEIAREKLLAENHQLRQKIKKIQFQLRKNDSNSQIQELKLKNQCLIRQIRVLKQVSANSQPRIQLKKAFEQIQKLEQQVALTKKELFYAVDALQIMQKRYRAQQTIREAKNHKIQEINKKYKDLINRVKQLKYEDKNEQQQKFGSCPEANDFKMKVIKIRR